MRILIVDDSKHVHTQLKIFLNADGYTDLFFAESAFEAFEMLGLNSGSGIKDDVDLILMDIEMDEMSGIEATHRISVVKELQDVPVLMVTADASEESLQEAFAAGAVDYITKPIRKVELLARIRSFLRLKQETDARKSRQKELLELTDVLSETNNRLHQANEKLKMMSLTDGLTGVCNRRYFDETLDREWRRMARDSRPLSLMMIDIDFFKVYNDTYGHQKGDECLKTVADRIRASVKRAADFVARYGGEEFSVVLPEMGIEEAAVLGRKICDAVAGLHLSHAASRISDHVTISIGIAGMMPGGDAPVDELIACADKALYHAKKEGRNRVVIFSDDIRSL